MPAPTYAQNKASIYRWKAKNIDKFREISRRSKRRCYHWKKIQIEFLNILL